jgi:hypothetical protein
MTDPRVPRLPTRQLMISYVFGRVVVCGMERIYTVLAGVIL